MLQKHDGIQKAPEGQRSPIKLPDLLLPHQSAHVCKLYNLHSQNSCLVNTTLEMLIKTYFNCLETGGEKNALVQRT